MANEIKQAQQSPRLENGTLYWYYGDSVKIDFKFDITIYGNAYSLGENDYAIIEVFNNKGIPFNTYASNNTNSNIVTASEDSNILVVSFTLTPTNSLTFKPTQYKYNIRLVRGVGEEGSEVYYKDTLINQNTIIVE